ncbi:glycosyltransferase [Janthinobacterium sp. Mn2066]|uniref:glycosyltransferase n=1 Tax=Janthinobacterium sp. Mn2066 TaxID=3395264 RepID=UPI003BE10888
MTDVTTINTGTYWDGRFSTDWESFEGPRQSRFFARLAIESLPHWLFDEIRRDRLSLVDWGCAQGDGTDVLASYIDAEQLSGVDFSAVAIEQASQRYPAIAFLNEDWLAAAPAGNRKFDVVFSSNTLEHFHQPYDVLRILGQRASKAIVLALPYRERDRIDEHFYSFLPENLPLVLDNGFRLAWSRVIDCRPLPNTLWGGEQVILVYAAPAWLDQRRMCLQDYRIEQDDQSAQSRQQQERSRHLHELLTERDTRILELRRQADALAADIANLHQQLQTSATENTSLRQSVADSAAEINNLSHSVVAQQAAQKVLDQMRNTRSWRLTGPLRFGARLWRYGLLSEDRQKLLRGLRKVYHRLPLPESVKRGLLGTYRKTVVSSYTAVRKQVLVSRPFDPPALRPAAQQADAPDYIVWGVIDWHFRHQRPQQLAQALALSGRRVFYVSVNLVDDTRAGFEQEQLDSAGRLFQIRLYAAGAPVIYTSVPTHDIVQQLRGSLGEVLDWANSHSIVSLIDHPFWYDVAAVLPNSRVIYDCMDHHEGFGNTAEAVLELERALMRNADLTITTSAWLDDVVAQHAPHRALIRNAGEFAHFAQRPGTIYAEPQGRKVIGYYGAIAEWFDLELVEALARRFSDCCILLIGADTVGAKGKLAHLPNVVMTGEMPYAQLPAYLHAFDVCLLPFKVIPLTLATNPVKVYEYLSAGKPVVSVDLPEMRQFDGLVRVGQDTGSFLSAVAEVLQDNGGPDAIVQRQHFAQEQTWNHRARDLISHAESAARDPMVSVIVVTYNNIDFTRACLASLELHTGHAPLEIIVVDNASSDGSPAFLKEWVSGASNRKLILNEDNRGFAAANNQGLAVASGDYLVLLNNDTYVTPGWIRTLFKHLQRDPGIGLIGPVTNNIGNQAKIQTSYSNMGEMLLETGRYTRTHIGQLFPLQTAAFFCVMFPRSVYQQVGDLDEVFGRGFFEDDDYCRRIEQLGLRIVCAEDVFIHHHLSASFNKVRSSERQALFEQNKATYEAKWGPWVPHNYKRDVV